MSITEDISSPAAVHATALPATTGSFTPPPGTLLAAFVANDGSTSAQSVDSVTDSLSGTWTQLKVSNVFTTGLGGAASIWIRDSPGTAMTVSMNATNAGTGHGSLVVKVLKGALSAASQPGATASNGGTAQNPSIALTPTQLGSLVYGVLEDFTTNETLTDLGTTVDVDLNPDAGVGDTYNVFKANTDTASLTSTTYGYTVVGRALNIVAVEILAALGGSPNPIWLPAFMMNSNFPSFMDAYGLPWLDMTDVLPSQPGGTNNLQTLTANLSFTGLAPLTIKTSKLMTASLSFVGALLRFITRAPSTAQVSFTGALPKQTVKGALTASVSFVGSIASQAVHHFTQSLNGSLSFIGSSPLTIKTLKSITAALSFVGALVKQTSTTRTAQVSFTGSVAKRTSTTRSAQVSFIGSVMKLTFRVLTASVSFVGSMTSQAVHHFTQSFTASLSFVGSLTSQAVHHFTQALSGSLSFVGSLVTTHTIAKALTASLSFAGSIVRRTGAVRTASLSFAGSQARAIGTRIASSLNLQSVFTIVPHVLSALVSFRIRVLGRESGPISGKESPGVVSYDRNDGGVTGRESPNTAGMRNDGPIGGEEAGT